MTGTMRLRSALVGMLALIGPACGPLSGGEPSADRAATGTGVSISRADLLAALEKKHYDLVEGVLEEMIVDALFADEANRRGVTVAQLLAVEVDAKVVPVTEAEKQAQYQAVKARVVGRPEAEILREIEQGMTAQRRAARRAAFAGELRTKAGVAVAIEPPRVAVEAANAPSQGPASAPVTLIEFSDFQCPYCSRGAETVRQVQKRYGDKVRIAFRHYPLPFHKQAAKAAEAAACAAEQGRFWEMHDRLFAQQSKLELVDLKRYATELGLEAKTFTECLDSGRLAGLVAADKDAGLRAGVSGTPAFFVNGRALTGAQPIERFVQAIDRELARAAAGSASGPAPK